jgi:tRNA-splicing endonuclease subunit Sen2
MAPDPTTNGSSNGDAQTSQPTSFTRYKKPNYNLIHALPLPVTTYPLPAFNPSSPLSILTLVYTFVRHLIAPPPSHPAPRLEGYWSSETRSVHVTDPLAVRLLWEKGFFGKGSQSRSEPTWLERERNRLGLSKAETSEQATARRREERKQFKKERAKKEREIIEQRLIAEGQPSEKLVVSENGHVDVSIPTSSDSKTQQSTAVSEQLEDGIQEERRKGTNTVKNVRFSETAHVLEVAETVDDILPATDNLESEEAGPEDVEQKEFLQLAPEEVFFLKYGLGVLDVLESNTSKSMSSLTLFDLLRRVSYFPSTSSADLKLDDPFLLSYVVYHHFRSLGWVVRSGVKFGVDFLLYNRGPVFSHAEFATVILPSYPDVDSEDFNGHYSYPRKERPEWWWLHSVSRIQSQVKKSILLAYVEIPPPDAISPSELKGEDIGRFLQRYRVREISSRRWIPNRSRD